MELIYRVKKPETIHRFMQENFIPSKILELEDEKHKIYVNNVLKSRKDTVKKGEKIHFFIKDEKRDEKVKPEDIALDIVFEGTYLLILDKPCDMQMMISKAHPNGTLANGINHYYQKNDISTKMYFITKLDREASGLIVIAKHRFIKFLLTNQDNSLTYYLKAIVEGKLDLKNSTIPLPISRMEGTIKREVSEVGDECLTNYKVLKEFKEFSLIDIWVKNKRAHQIRVHFSYFFCPIIGDKIYGNAKSKEPLMLHCYKMDFNHPITEEKMLYEIDVPEYFNTYIK